LFYDKVAIIGVGLLGGSVGLALKDREMCGKIVGLGRSSASIEAGLKIGAIDESADELIDAAAGADLIVVSTPVGAVPGIIEEMESLLEDECIITDVGSAKGEIVRAVEQMPRAAAAYIGSHPLAGSEKKGVLNASADLFEDAIVFLTPTETTDPARTAAVTELWELLGGKVVELDPDVHDHIVARTSHLPHIIAALLVANLRALDPEHAGLVGKGFLDTTRIASSDPEMWADICLSNPEQIREAIVELRSDLDEFDLFIDEGDYGNILEFFGSMKSVRDSFNRNPQNG
jgi:prephenate dehydrogenase